MSKAIAAIALTLAACCDCPTCPGYEPIWSSDAEVPPSCLFFDDPAGFCAEGWAFQCDGTPPPGCERAPEQWDGEGATLCCEAPCQPLRGWSGLCTVGDVYVCYTGQSIGACWDSSASNAMCCPLPSTP